MASWTHNR